MALNRLDVGGTRREAIARGLSRAPYRFCRPVGGALADLVPSGAPMQPRTHYVRGPEGHVAYQVFGRGARDIVFIPDHPNNIDIMWEEPALSRFLERLGSI